MSDTSTLIYGAKSDGTLNSYREIEKSSLGALNIWNFLAKKYFGMPFSSMIKDGIEEMVWNLISYDHMPIDEKILLATTFDGAYVTAEDMHYVAIAISTLSERGLVGNLGEQLEAIASMYKEDDSMIYAWDHNPAYSSYWGDKSTDRNINTFVSFNVFDIEYIQKPISQHTA